MTELYDGLSFIIFENVAKSFSEFMKEKDIKLPPGEPEGFASYCADNIIKSISTTMENQKDFEHEDGKDILINEKGMYKIGILSDPDEASKAITFRSNVATILKAVRMKFDYLDIEAGEFFSFLCNATEEELKQKIETYLGVYL